MNATTKTLVDSLTPDERYSLKCDVEHNLGSMDMASDALVQELASKLLASRLNAQAGKAAYTARLKAKQAAKLALATGKAGR
jgi:hypothetical protein